MDQQMMEIQRLANDQAVLRSAVGVLRMFYSKDSDIKDAIAVLNRKQFEYLNKLISLTGVGNTGW